MYTMEVNILPLMDRLTKFSFSIEESSISWYSIDHATEMPINFDNIICQRVKLIALFYELEMWVQIFFSLGHYVNNQYYKIVAEKERKKRKL